MPLSVIDPNEPFQQQYQPVIDELVRYFRASLGTNFHSLYIYGSVARKCATPNGSNIDVVLVVFDDFERDKATILNTLRWRIQNDYPFITDVSIKVALVKEVASLESLFSWGFLLRHCAVCVWGDNLSECFGDYEPSWEIAKFWNMDLADCIVFYRDKIAKAATPASQIDAQRLLAKKLLRAAYSLVMYKDKSWFDNPVECGDHFLRYFPEKETDIKRLCILLKHHKVIPKRSVVGLLDNFGQWLVKQYQKTEFKIG